ncbi:MAG: NfeD family protein [Verrucomicrobiales bacterium]
MFSTLVILTAAGLLMIIIELFIPGMIMGILGVICLVVACVFAFTEFGPEVGTLFAIGSVVACIILFFVWMKVFPHSPFGKIFTLGASVGGGGEARRKEMGEVMGKTGEAITLLRPTGVALIEGKRIDVVAEADLIQPGAKVEVIAIDGLRVIVKASKD